MKRIPQMRKTTVWGDIYNQRNAECKWPVSKMGFPVRDCNFIMEAHKVIEFGKTSKEESINGTDEVVVLVKIPAGTKIYHSATIYQESKKGEKEWFEEYPPFSSERGVVWFSSTPAHAGIFSKTHLLEYTTTEDLIMIYEKNIKRSHGIATRGYEYAKKVLPSYMKRLRGEKIDGYIGCNECEIGIFNRACKDKLEMPPIVVMKLGLKYID